MHLIDFYFILAKISDFLPVIPILVGIKMWNVLSTGLKCFIGYLIFDLLLNITSYNIHANNRFLGYFYSFSYCVSIITMYSFFVLKKSEKLTLFSIMLINVILIIVDLKLIEGLNQNYFSSICIDLSIFCIGIYYFSKYLFHKNTPKIESELLISIVIIFTFFIKALAEFLDIYLIENSNNAFLWFQMRNIYYYFIILSSISFFFILKKFR